MATESLASQVNTLKQYSSASTSRLQSLYSDFARQKLSNPAGYQANVEWWGSTLENIVIRGWQPTPDSLILNANAELVDGLRWSKLGKPLGLGSVVTELSASRRIIPLEQYLSSPRSVYATYSIPSRIASYLVVKPLWWVLEHLSIVDEGETVESSESKWKKAKGQYVMLSNLEKAAEAVIEHQRSKPRLSLSNSLYNFESFRLEFSKSIFPGVTLSDMDLKVLLKYLDRDRQVLVSQDDVLKFVDPFSQSSQAITAVDHGVLEMKAATERLTDQIDEIQRKIVERTAKATEHIKQKQKDMALSYLRSRKLLEDLLAKRLNSLETIQTAFLKIESAAGDIEIMKAYETSTSTLKNLLAHPSLQRDHVDATMESMADALADHTEIEEAIKLGGEGARTAAGVEEIDEKELEAELEDLIKLKQLEDLEEKEKAAKRQAAEKAAREREEEERKEKEKAEEERRLREEEQRLQREAREHELRIAREAAAAQRASVVELQRTAEEEEKELQLQRNREEEIKIRAKWEQQSMLNQ